MATKISAGTTTGTALNFSADTTGILQLATGSVPTTAITIDASQNTMVSDNTTTVTGAGAIERLRIVNVNGTGGASAFGQFKFSNDANPVYHRIYKSRGTAVNTYTAVANADNLYELDVLASDGTGFIYTAGIAASVEGAVSTGIIPTNLKFSTSGVSTSGTLTEQMRIDSAGLLKFNSGYGSVATAYGCRAWVNFNGTGTVAIRASGNVSSITDNGVGDYTVNFTTALVDANYSINATTSTDAASLMFIGINGTNTVVTTASVRISITNNAGASVDRTTLCISVFR